MIRPCLIVDTETTSLDRADGRVIELAALLYSVENRTILSEFASLMPGVANEAEKINRIPPAALCEMTELAGTLVEPLKDTFRRFRSAAEVIVCHNVEFDRKWFPSEWHSLPWICTAFDFEWPMASREAGSLIHLALEHGIGVSRAHRALADCHLIAALFDRMPLFGRDLQQMFDRAMRPKAIFQGLQKFEENEVAKKAGFKWNGETKKWTRRMAIEDAALLPFPTVLLEEVA